MLKMRLAKRSALAVTLALCATVAHAMNVPSMASNGLSWDDMVTPEVAEGVVMETRGYNVFYLQERTYRVFEETDINGVPAASVAGGLHKGMRVKVTSYRLKDKTRFASEITILR